MMSEHYSTDVLRSQGVNGSCDCPLLCRLRLKVRNEVVGVVDRQVMGRLWGISRSARNDRAVASLFLVVRYLLPGGDGKVQVPLDCWFWFFYTGFRHPQYVAL